jgi:hypothetical protein
VGEVNASIKSEGKSWRVPRALGSFIKLTARLTSREADLTLSRWTRLDTGIWLVIFATFHAHLAIIPGSTTFRGLPKISKVTVIMQGIHSG